MTSEFLLEAIGQMDDELVLEAAAPVKRHIPWGQVAGWAAAIVLCVGIAHMPGLPLNGAGAAAPENAAPQEEQTKHHLMADAADGAGDYEYRTEQESQVQTPSAEHKSESVTAGGAMGIVEPQFFTERGVYLLVAPPLQQTPPPEGAKELGKLTAFRYDEQVYPAVRAKELEGCSVWESEDGEYLYVQMSDEGWLTAKLMK